MTAPAIPVSVDPLDSAYDRAQAGQSSDSAVTMDPRLKSLLDRYAVAGATDDEIRQVAADWKQQYNSGAQSGVSNADLWEMLKASGVAPDSATAIVRTHPQMSNADLWERIVQNGAPENAATQIVRARSGYSDPLDAVLAEQRGASTPPSGDPLDAVLAEQRAKGGDGLTLANIARAFGMGATFGLAKSTALPASMRLDAAKAAAFKNANPVTDFLLKLAGGMVAPAAAVAAAPELAGVGGAALLGGGAAALDAGGADSDQNIPDAQRAKNVALGAAIGAPLSVLGYGASKAIGSGLNAVLDRVNPSRAVARAALPLLPNDAQARIDRVNALAPGGASIASVSTPMDASAVSRLLRMAYGVGANPDAASAAESKLLAQRTALRSGARSLGAKMDALDGELPLSDDVRAALVKVRDVLGSNAPAVPPAEVGDANPLGIEKSTPFAFDPAARTLNISDARDALSRLRYIARTLAKRGVDANGVTVHDVNGARAALQDALYNHTPEFAPLDAQYATLADQTRQVNALLKAVRASRANYAANEAYGARAGSIGGSIPTTPAHFAAAALDAALPTRRAAATAVSRYLLNPASGDAVARLTAAAPATHPIAARAAVAAPAAVLPALRGLLLPDWNP